MSTNQPSAGAMRAAELKKGIRTTIVEYTSEAEARGHKPHRFTVVGGLATEAWVMWEASRQCDRWVLPYAIFEVIESVGDDTRVIGNFDEALADCEMRLLNKLEDGLGLRRGSILPALRDSRDALAKAEGRS